MSEEPTVPQPHAPVWPGVVLGFGLGLSVSWAILLGHEFIKLVKFVI